MNVRKMKVLKKKIFENRKMRNIRGSVGCVGANIGRALGLCRFGVKQFLLENPQQRRQAKTIKKLYLPD